VHPSEEAVNGTAPYSSVSLLLPLQALAAFAAALAAHPACIAALVGCAAVYKEAGLLEEAVQALERALAALNKAAEAAAEPAAGISPTPTKLPAAAEPGDGSAAVATTPRAEEEGAEAIALPAAADVPAAEGRAPDLGVVATPAGSTPRFSPAAVAGGPDTDANGVAAVQPGNGKDGSSDSELLQRLLPCSAADVRQALALVLTDLGGPAGWLCGVAYDALASVVTALEYEPCDQQAVA
jgi:tetratricopeptide (TPR) repeat protein